MPPHSNVPALPGQLYRMRNGNAHRSSAQQGAPAHLPDHPRNELLLRYPGKPIIKEPGD